MFAFLKRFPCHRIEDRCVVIGKERLPICYRCFGILVGIVVGIPVHFAGVVKNKWGAIVFLVPIFLDVVSISHGFWIGNKWIRLTTGVLAGIGILVFFWLWLANDIERINLVLRR